MNPSSEPAPKPDLLPPTRRDMIRGAVGLFGVAALPTFGVAAPEPAANRAVAPDAQTLAERAAICESQVMDVARGPGGLIISHTRFDTRLPLQEGDVPPPLHRVLDAVWGKDAPKPTAAEWYYGEDTLGTTGCMLNAQMARFRVTRDEKALALARKCFQDLNHVFDLCRAIEPGLLGKPHGGRAGATTSFDQSANPVLPYAEFALTYATAEEREQARRNLHDHADYYIRRNWQVNQHGHLSRIVPARHTSAMKYFASVHAAYDVTGEDRFRDEALKRMRELLAGGLIPWPSKVEAPNPGNLYYYSYLSEYWSKTSLAAEADWIADIGLNWKIAQLSLSNEGLVIDGKYDLKTQRFVRAPEHATGFQGRIGASLVVAILGLIARRHGLDGNAHEVARRILLRADPSTFRQIFDDGSLSDDDKVYSNLFPSSLPAIWLMAYWQGREQNAW